MRTCINFSLVFVLISVCAAKANVTKVSLDGPDSACNGNPLEIKERSEIHLFSKGMVQTSMCSIRINAQRSHNCRGVCFNLKRSNFADCSAKLITTEIYFGELVPDVIKEEDCQKSMEVPWCSSAHTLKLDLVVDDTVMTPKYNFSVTVYPRCGDDVVYKPPARVDFEEGIKISLIHGAVVGISLCSMFIMILVVACCYHKLHSNRRHTISSVSKEKILKISGEERKESSSDPKGVYLTINGMEKEEANLLISGGSTS